MAQSEGSMPIPKLESEYLPAGVYECDLEEIRETFGINERRQELIDNLSHYIQKLREIGIDEGYIIINGSFVTKKEEPGDIDIIVVTSLDNFLSNMSEQETAIWDENYVKQKFELHMFPAIKNSKTEYEMTEFFSGVREDPDTVKGLLKVDL